MPKKYIYIYIYISPSIPDSRDSESDIFSKGFIGCLRIYKSAINVIF